MQKTPVIIAIICGLVAFFLMRSGGLPTSSSDPSSSKHGNIKVEQMVTANKPTAADKKKADRMKADALQTLSGDNYIWQLDCKLAVTPLVRCINSQKEFDHNVYAYDNGNEQGLIVICHGGVDSGEYGILIGEQYRTDYIQAIEEVLAYWSRKGSLQNAPFEFVVLTTCFSGYAQPESQMPIFNIILQMENDNKNVNSFFETDEEGQTMLYLFRGTPRSAESVATDNGKRKATKEERDKMTVLGCVYQGRSIRND